MGIGENCSLCDVCPLDGTHSVDKYAEWIE
jgi:hypothetical protein